MTDKAKSMFSSWWARLIVASLISAGGAAAPVLVSLGEYKAEIKTTRQDVQKIEEVTKAHTVEVETLKTDIAVLKNEKDHIYKSLEEIKEQQKEMLRLLRRK